VAASPSRTTLAVATLSASAGDAEWEAPNRPAPSRRAWRWLATVPVAALAFVAVGVLTMRGGSLPQQPPIVAGNPPPHVLAPPPAEATVTFSDAPPSLTVTVDGVPVEPPIRLQPGRSARIEARAPGYEPLVLELDAVAGTDRVVSLRRMAVATPTNPKRPRRDGHAARPRIQDNASEVSKPFSERHEWAH
jgi:hypothetical protein